MPPLRSSASPVQTTLSPTPKAPSRVLLSALVELAATPEPATVQLKVVVRASSSASETVAVQISVSARVAPELGDRLTETTGSRLSRVRSAVPSALPASMSEAVTVQVTVSALAAPVVDKSIEALEPKLPAALPDHA